MTYKATMKKQIRGWFPQEPAINFIKGTPNKAEFHKTTFYPFLAPGALMIFTALLLANFGLTLTCAYLPDALAGAQNIYYPGIYVGILSIAGFILGLISGILLLAKKGIITAVICTVAIFSFGIATVLIPPTFGSLWQNGLVIALPMVVSSLTSLIWVGKNSNILRGSNIVEETMLTIQSEPPNIRKPVVAGLFAAGLGFIFVGVLTNFTMNIYLMNFEVYFYIVGGSLLVTAYLERRTYTLKSGESSVWK